MTHGSRPDWGERLRRVVKGRGREGPAPQAHKTTPERRQMTVMFVDLVGSTSIAERHEPEVVRDVVRRYQEVCGEAISRRRGLIAWYAGDGVMAYFGFPVAHEDDARQAALAGLDIIAALDHDLAPAVRAEHGIDLGARIGIHTGLVLVTEMGAAGRPEPNAVVGATPNEAARIQSVAPDGAVAISGATYEIVRGYFEVESLGKPVLKGVARDLEVFRVLRATHASDRLQAAGRVLTPLVGRDRELRVVHEQWDSVGAGASGSARRNRIVLVTGEAGIGKSRLAAQIVREILADGHAVLVATCSRERTSSALYPVVRVLETALGLAAPAGDASPLERLQRVCEAAGLRPEEAVPILAPLFDVATGDRYGPLALDARVVRERTFAALTALITSLSGDDDRLLFVIEDLQWADQSTLELMVRLAGAPRGGMVLLGTSRPEFVVPWIDVPSTTIHLDRLPTEEHRQLIQLLARALDVPEAYWDVIEQRSDGNPLFTEELAQAAHVGGERHAAAGSIPATIRDLLTARLDAVGDHKHLAQVASTLGREIDVDVLRAVTELPRRPLAAGLDALTQAGILEELARPEGSVTHRFVHALVRDAAYDSQERLHDRRDAHLRVARALIGRRDADPELIAQHFDAAGSAEQAVEYYVLAASTAQRSAAHAEAMRMLNRALELAAVLPEGAGRDVAEINVRILRGLNVVSTQGYAAPGAAEDYRRALDLSGRAGSNLSLFPATVGIWAFYAVDGNLHAAGEAVDRLQVLSRPEVLPEVLSCVGTHRFFEGRFDEARQALDTAVALFEGRPLCEAVSQLWQLPNDPYVAALTHLGLLQWFVGECTDAITTLDRAVTRASSLPFPGPFSQGYALTYAGWLANLEGRHGDACRHIEQVVEVSERHGFAFWLATAACHAAISEGYAGDAAEGAARLAAGIAQWRDLGAGVFVPCLLTDLAAIRLRVGTVDQALADIDAALALAEDSGERLFVAEERRVRAAVMRAQGLPVADVRRELEASLEVARRQGALMFELRAVTDLVELDRTEGIDGREALRQLIARLPHQAKTTNDVIRAQAMLG